MRNDIIVNAVMLQNVMDMSGVILELIDEGYDITGKQLGKTSPLLTDHLNRFGQYVANMEIEPVDIARVMKLPIK